MEGHILHRLADLMGCEVGSLLTSYLGLPLCIGNASKSLLSPVVERVEQKLVLWRAKCLSLGGRVALIKSALANTPIYFMSRFNCSMSIVNRIERLEREFFWLGRNNKKKFHFICLQIQRGWGTRF